MSKKSKDAYDELMEMYFENTSVGSNHSSKLTPYHNSTNCDSFFTSEEIVKQQKEIDNDPFADGKTGVVNKGKIDESLVFDRISKKRVHKYTDKEKEEMRKSCMNTYVHDYGEMDVYHLSDEAKAELDMLSEIAGKLSTLKGSYAKVDQYIKAMRIVYEAWDILATNNKIHTREEFFTLVAEGEIISNRIIIPKLRYAKRYDPDTIALYVSDLSLDPSDLVEKVEDQLWEGDEGYESEEQIRDRILSPDEQIALERIEDDPDSLEPINVSTIQKKYVKDYNSNSKQLSIYASKKLHKKHKSKLNKSDRNIYDRTTKMLRKVESKVNNKNANSLGYGGYNYSQYITSNMFDDVEKDDFWDNLRFDGSWANKEDVEHYERVIEEKLMNKRAVGEQYRTNSDIDIANFFKEMENAGMNVLEIRRNLSISENDSYNVYDKRNRKESKKLEAKVFTRIKKSHNSDKFKKLISKSEKNMNKYD